jgi:hypothetical protein
LTAIIFVHPANPLFEFGGTFVMANPTVYLPVSKILIFHPASTFISVQSPANEGDSGVLVRALPLLHCFDLVNFRPVLKQVNNGLSAFSSHP